MTLSVGVGGVTCTECGPGFVREGGGVAWREEAFAMSLRSLMNLGTENLLCCRKMRGECAADWKRRRY